MSLKRANFNKKQACQRKTNVVTKTKSNKHFDETLIARQMIEAFIKGEYDPGSVDVVKEDVSVGYAEENIDDVREIQDSSVETLSKSLYRFINSFCWPYGDPDPEHQAVFIPDGPIYLDLTDWIEKKDGTLFEDCDDIEVRFTWIRKDIIKNAKESQNVGTLEGAILRKGRPDISETARGQNNPLTDIWLHIMRHALRKYADTFLDEGQAVNIQATYYFLRKDTDKTDKAYEIEDYFADTKGIRCQKEIYTKMKDGIAFPDNDLDTKFRELLEKFATGYDKCELKEETDCKGCTNYLSCYFKEPPIPVVDEDEGNKITARGSIDQDEYQQVVTDFRAGTGIVDAPPGSGKTEITTERTVQMAIEMLDDIVARYEAGEDVDIPVNATFLCKNSEGLEAEILINGKSAAQNWAEVEDDLSDNDTEIDDDEFVF